MTTCASSSVGEQFWNYEHVSFIGRVLLLQVANYCSERIHLALAEEVGVITDNLSNGRMEANQQLQWEKNFTRCFHKVDDEIGGKVGSGDNGSNGDASEPVASETVGSTAVVALICSSHIIVANCGDSRAVLCRGKEAMALSIDHKVGHVFSFCYLYTFMDQSSLPWEPNILSYFNFPPAKQRR